MNDHFHPFMALMIVLLLLNSCSQGDRITDLECKGGDAHACDLVKARVADHR